MTMPVTIRAERWITFVHYHIGDCTVTATEQSLGVRGPIDPQSDNLPDGWDEAERLALTLGGDPTDVHYTEHVLWTQDDGTRIEEPQFAESYARASWGTAPPQYHGFRGVAHIEPVPCTGAMVVTWRDEQGHKCGSTIVSDRATMERAWQRWQRALPPRESG